MLGCFIATLLALAATQSVAAAKPNVLVIMTDDQDMLLDSLSVMPNVTGLIGGKGVRYEKHYCTIAWCCPSRVNLLTGRAAHNTNVTTLNLPYGGWPKFIQEGLNDNYIANWVKAAGARTYYVGKLMNSYQMKNWDRPYPKDWTNSSFLVDPWTYNYYNSTWTLGDSKGGTHNVLGTHTTWVTRDKAENFIDDAADSGEQFFMMVAPVAPHAQMKYWGYPQAPPPPPKEYDHLFNDAVSPRTPNFNPDDPSGVSWVYQMPKLTQMQVEANDHFHRSRLRNLVGVDDLVGALIQKLDARGLLDNTYVIYTSDNGFHISNHRLTPGKRCGFEEDINIPLLIRGPGMPSGITTNITNSHTDIAPTVLQMMGIDLRDDFDGEPIPITQPDLTNSTKYEHVNVEFWDSPHVGMMETDDGEHHAKGSYYNNTYKSLRLNTPDGSFYYSVWCTGEKEFYDMNRDQYQMNNLLRATTGPLPNWTYFGRSAPDLIARLDALLMVLKSCKQDTCRDPYSVLFPKGQVANLSAAMDKTYDKYFDDAPKVSFQTCFTGAIPDLEGPMEIKAYSAACRTGQTGLGLILVVSGWALYWALHHLDWAL